MAVKTEISLNVSWSVKEQIIKLSKIYCDWHSRNSVKSTTVCGWKVWSSSELPGLLEMTLTHTEEDHLEVTWRIPSCNMRLVSAVVDHYVLSFCSTSDCMSENIWTWTFVRLYLITFHGLFKVAWPMKR